MHRSFLWSLPDIFYSTDVQPALKEDGRCSSKGHVVALSSAYIDYTGWSTEPFELHHDLKSGRLYGRG